MVSDSDTSTASQQSIKAYVNTYGQNDLFTNALINGGFDVWQRGTSFTGATTPANSDDTYLMDRWVLLSDGNDIVDVSQSTDKPDGSGYSAKFDVQSSQEFGIVQILESVDSLKLDNQAVSLSFAAKTDSSEITTIRAAVLSWSSTADAVTSDVVATWGATPTWATNWTAENTPGDITITDSWATYEIENISINTASMANVAVVIWTPGAESTNDTLYLSQIQLNKGAEALSFQARPLVNELANCQRYCESVYANDADSAVGSGICNTTTVSSIYVPFRVSKRSTSTLTATAGDWNLRHAGATTAVTAISLLASGRDSTRVRSDVASGLTAGNGAILVSSGTNKFLLFDSEL
jgi:hypothetical protein